MIDKDTKMPSKLLWVDLEMTGLDAGKDVILEVAAEVTDFNFKTIVSYEARVQQKREVVIERMQQNIWWKDYPENRDEFIAKLDEARPLKEVEQDLVAIVAAQFDGAPAVLAGNSIYNDRKFITRYWPALDLKLHYRMLDVSAFKVLMQGKYTVEFEKKEDHRAFEDIQASIAELQYYLKWLGANGRR